MYDYEFKKSYIYPTGENTLGVNGLYDMAGNVWE